MKKVVLSMLLVCYFATVYSQNYQISFAGTGASTTVDSVKIENLSQCTSMSIGGSDLLNLTSSVGLSETNISNNGIRIYPNPSAGSCSIEFQTDVSCNANIELYDITGRNILKQNEFLTSGYHTFVLNDLNKGTYFLQVESDHYVYTAKVISYSTKFGTPSVRDVEHTLASPDNRTAKTKSTISMQFNAGDTLKLTGKSGIYRTVVMLMPASNQTVTFTFVDCTDADGNHYAVVQIGTQTWMAENLKTTRYRDNSSIPNVPDSATWGITATGAYCDYHNDPTEWPVYGHLYNFYAVEDSHNISPVGWHVATNHEWNLLQLFIESTIDTTAFGARGSVIGRILKEGCTTRWQYMDTTAGFNSVGFTALCANYRIPSGGWSLAPNNNHDCGFWTSTPYNASSAWYNSLRWCYANVYTLFPMKKSGYSIRCVKD